jgi:hypothetical protein
VEEEKEEEVVVVVVVYMRRKQTVKGVLKGFVQKVINLNWMSRNKQP